MFDYHLLKQSGFCVAERWSWSVSQKSVFKREPNNPVLPNLGIPRSITICSNRTNIVPTFQEIVKNAEIKYEAKAYLHWYKKYGLEEETFLESFEGVRNIIQNYNQLWRE